MVKLLLTSKQFKGFQEALEKEQKEIPDANVQIFIESNSKTASGGFGFTFDPLVLSSLH